MNNVHQVTDLRATPLETAPASDANGATDQSTLAEWCARARALYAQAMIPVQVDDPRAQVLADASVGPTHRTADPELLAGYYWEYISARELPHPPFAWPTWVGQCALQAEAWGGGVVEIVAQGSEDIGGASVLYQQRFLFDPAAETVTPEGVFACVTTPDEEDEVWVSQAHLSAFAAATKRANQVLNAVGGANE